MNESSTRVRPGGGPAHIDSPHSISGLAAPGGALVQQVESNKLVPWICLACILAGAAIVMGWMAYRMASIATMRVEGMTRALIAHGVKNTYPHVPGEDD